MRVLLVAEEASPELASVPLVGWAHSRAIAGIVDAHVVTQVRSQPAFERAGLTSKDFTAIDNEYIARPLFRIGGFLRGGADKGWTTLMALKALEYRSFERLLWRRFGDDIRKGRYDLVHRITPLSPTVPSRLAKWCQRAGVPFVLGPLNGGLPWPAGFGGTRRREREWLSYVRGAYKLLPGYRSTRRHSAALILGSRATWQQMPERYRQTCVYVPENAVDADQFDLASPLAPRSDGPLRLVFIGRLVPYKGADMLLEAASKLLRSGLATLQLIGDGPERNSLEQAVTRMGLENSVEFTGWIAHEEVASHVRRADVFAFPSIREFGGGVVLEAMAQGVVPVVLDYGGPGELVSSSTGFSLPMGDRDQIIARFEEVLTRLAGDVASLAPMRAAARQRVMKHFTWNAKAQQIMDVYRWALGHADKPDLGMPIPD